jgi:hypothetical protein
MVMLHDVEVFRKMGNHSVRLQMSSQTRQALELISLDYGCLYGGKPHISGLLAQIADGRLELKPRISLRPHLLNDPLLKLTFCLPGRLRGGLFQVSSAICNAGANIFKVNVSDKAGIANAQVLISLPESCDLGTLVKMLQRIRIRDVGEFNTKEEILDAIHQWKSTASSPQSSAFRDDPLKDGLDIQQQRMLTDRLVDKTAEQQLLSDLSLTFGLRLIASNQVGVMFKVTREIAEQGFNLSSAVQEFDVSTGNDIIDLMLTLHLRQQIDLAAEVQKINVIEAILLKVSAIKSIQRLGIDYL